MGDTMTIGERIAFYRQRRDLTQAVLAGMVGKSEDWLSKIERGERQAQRIDILVGVARELPSARRTTRRRRGSALPPRRRRNNRPCDRPRARVTLGALVGEPVLAEDDQRNDNVPAIRDVLMTPRRLSRIMYRDNRQDTSKPPLPWAQQHVDSAWREYQRGRGGRVIAALPD